MSRHKNAIIVGTPDLQTTTRDEKRSSPSQSNSSSQSCSTDHLKSGGVSRKEDARNSAAGSGTVTKTSDSSSWQQQSINGLLLLKKYQSGLTCEKATYSHMAEVTTGHKFVVKVPNSGRSSAQSTTGGSPYGYLAMNRSSHVLSEKREQLDRKSGTYQENVVTDVNVESLLRNDFKYVLTGYDEGDGSAAAVPDEENCQTKEDARKSTNVTKTAFSSSGNELKSQRLVAAEEISKSDVALPIDSPQRNTPVENSSRGNDIVLKYSAGDEVIRDPNQFIEGAEDEHIKQGVIGNSWPEHADSKTGSYQDKSGELNEHLTSSNLVSIVKMITGIGDSKEHQEKKAVGGDNDAVLDSKHKGSISLVNEVVMSTVLDVEHKKNIPGSFDGSSESHQKAPAVIGHSTNGTDKEALPLSSKGTILENVDEKVEKDVETGACCHASHSEKQRPEWERKAYALDKGEHVQEILEGNEDREPEVPSPCKASATWPTAAAKGPFVPPDDLLRNKGALVGRGSATIRPSGGLDLDLNRVDELANMPNHTTGNNHRLEVFMPISSSTGGVLDIEARFNRDFDLNDGPVVDQVTVEPSSSSQHGRSSNMQSQSPVPRLRINNTEMANFSSWFPTGNTYSAIIVPSILTDSEQPFPKVATGVTPFNTDVYRGHVLSSSPVVPFPATPIQYPMFPFGTTFPPTSFSGGSITYADSSPN
ncbi:hypothetical protein V6N11_000599 [Hibiscus sabdariffa]|uniref:Uncharacterized protein n=1 Tax=Hibiscus sabdariffa TaxID=183260 RepID=A0ABR2N7J6_9ROSI